MMSAALALPASRAAANPFAAEPRFAAAGILLALSLAVTLPAASLDPRLFQDESIWLKPIKFQIALALYLLTLAFFARWLPEGMTDRRRWRVYAALVALAAVAEMLWIGGAAMAGTASHFNTEIPLMTALYAVMGVIAVFMTSASLVMGVAIWRNPASGLAPALRLAIGLGLVLTFALTLPIAGTLSSNDGHFVGTPLTGASVPIFGWSREVGDLRSAHFLATHAMHFLPLAGLLAVALLPERAAVRATWAAAVVFVAVTLGAFALALAGLPLVPLA
jgi:hypothetical protein